MKYKYLIIILFLGLQLISCKDDDNDDDDGTKVKYRLRNENLEAFFKENKIWTGTMGNDTITLTLYKPLLSSYEFVFDVDSKIDGHLIYKANESYKELSIYEEHLNNGTIRNYFWGYSYYVGKDTSFSDSEYIYFDLTTDKKLILYDLNEISYRLGDEYKKVVLTNIKDIFPRNEARDDFNKILYYGSNFINISQSDSINLQTMYNDGNGYLKYLWSYKEYGKDNLQSKIKYERSISPCTAYRYYLSEGNFSDYFCSVGTDDSQITKEIKYKYNDPILTLYDFPTKGESRTLYHATEKITKPDNNLLAGGWYSVQEKDSTILLFENNTMKEYVYQKNTNNILTYNNNGEYSLKKNNYGYNDMILSIKDSLKTTGKSYEYKLDNSSLELTQGNVSLKYKKLK